MKIWDRLDSILIYFLKNYDISPFSGIFNIDSAKMIFGFSVQSTILPAF